MEKEDDHDPPFSKRCDYVFGFGSIINTDTHAPWLTGTSSGRTTLDGQCARIRESFGYRRGWNFRSNTGFTALGITRADENEATDINGVLFVIPHEMLDGFDRREVGYDRVGIGLEHIELLSPPIVEADSGGGNRSCLLNIKPDEKIWVYIPQNATEADEDHPILQSYVDTVMQGCLEWGGEEMAMEFVATTSSWSPYFLNDTPSSRRPWLFRKEYNTIDRILSRNPATHFADRRHPEEFASAFLIKMMRGAWSIPRRNTVFTGRDVALGQIHARLSAQRADPYLQSGVAKLEVAGMGGVGKTQICTEYCYRYFPSYYGLVIWLSAQSAESVAAGYRQLMADTTGVDVKDKDTDEVVAEVKARLFRSKVPWLLVFDNLEDRSLLEKFVPHGGSGHVLVTTRLVNTEVTDFDEETMILGCLNPSESVELLCRSAGKQNISGEAHINAANQLACQLGHLPLALGMAGAYMRRCDVDCLEYLARYVGSENSGALLGHEAVSASLSISLDAIKEENPTAWEALRLLGWLGSDQITKSLLRSLLKAKFEVKDVDATKSQAEVKVRLNRLFPHSLWVGLVVCSVVVMGKRARVSNRWVEFRLGIGALAVVSVSAYAALTSSAQCETADAKPITRKPSFSANIFEQTDQIWTILKSFSLLAVKEGKGSMHRLLAQALRASQDEEDSRRNLQICILAVRQAWHFKPEQVETWQSSANLLEHVKAVASHAAEYPGILSMETAVLSREAGVFSAMALNRFEEAQFSLEQSLMLLDGASYASSGHAIARERAAALHERGRVFRYEGNYNKSEEALLGALEIRNQLGDDLEVSATLHELGVLEVKKHSLDSADAFLQKALDLRRSLESASPCEEIEGLCAATLHQLATVQVARKPPCLDKAEALLKEALGLNMQIGSRAATLKQLARVAIRRGELDGAENSLVQALELYVELYGESTLHINVAAVKFQQGALAFQREQLEQAWLHFSECLHARRHVYAYSQGNHLEVSSVLHELGCVAFAQKRISKANEMLIAEKAILDQLFETSSQRHRLLQARLTNLTWLRKCAKERGDDDEARKITAERSKLKRNNKETKDTSCRNTLPLQREVQRCRLEAREFALSKPEGGDHGRQKVSRALARLAEEIEKSPPCSMKEAAIHFHAVIVECLPHPNNRSTILEACDDLRNVLRDHGLQVSDTVRSERGTSKK